MTRNHVTRNHSCKQLSRDSESVWILTTFECIRELESAVRLGVTVTQSTRRALAHCYAAGQLDTSSKRIAKQRGHKNEMKYSLLPHGPGPQGRSSRYLSISEAQREATCRLLAGCPGNMMHCQCDPLKNICPSILAALSSFPLSATVTAIPSIWLKNLGHLQVGRRRIA